MHFVDKWFDAIIHRCMVLYTQNKYVKKHEKHMDFVKYVSKVMYIKFRLTGMHSSAFMFCFCMHAC